MPNISRNPDPPITPEQLDLFLDGQLSGEAARKAESAIQRDAGARQAASTQARIDAALKNHFQPPDADHSVWLALAEEANGEPALGADKPSVEQATPHAPPAVSTNHRRSPRQNWKMVLAIAASLACISLWGSQWGQLSSLWRSPDNGYGRMTVAQVYKTAVEDGFQPDWFCEDEQLFAETFEQRQGQGLLLKPLPADVRMAGLAYLKGFTPMATCMLAYVDEKPVLVLTARTERIDKEQLEASSEVAVFRRELDGLTLIEVLPAKATPGDSPRLLPYFYSAETPKQPTGRVPGSR